MLRQDARVAHAAGVHRRHAFSARHHLQQVLEHAQRPARGLCGRQAQERAARGLSGDRVE